jgi:glutathione S-transferase
MLVSVMHGNLTTDRIEKDSMEDEQLGESRIASERVLGILDTHLEKNEYLTGDAIDVSDFAIMSTLSNCDHAGIDLLPFSSIRAYRSRIRSLDAWASTCPPVEVGVMILESDRLEGK